MHQLFRYNFMYSTHCSAMAVNLPLRTMSNIDVERSKAREAFIQARKQARRHQLGAKLRGEGGQLLPV